jgi:hypothetical protein
MCIIADTFFLRAWGRKDMDEQKKGTRRRRGILEEAILLTVWEELRGEVRLEIPRK